MNDTTESPPPSPQRVEARASKDPAVRLFIASGMFLAFGLWCIYEAFILEKFDIFSLPLKRHI